MSKHRNFKTHERQTAKRLGGQRQGHLGGSDVTTDDLAVECKSRKSLPLWLHQAMSQAEGHAGPMQQCVVVLHEVGKRYDDDFVVMRMSTFQQMYGGLINAELVRDD